MAGYSSAAMFLTFFYTSNLSTHIQRALNLLSHVATLISCPVSCLWRILRVQGGIFPIFDNKKTEALVQLLKSLRYHNFQVQTAQRAGEQNVKNGRREKQKEKLLILFKRVLLAAYGNRGETRKNGKSAHDS